MTSGSTFNSSNLFNAFTRGIDDSCLRDGSQAEIYEERDEKLEEVACFEKLIEEYNLTNALENNSSYIQQIYEKKIDEFFGIVDFG